MSREMPWRTDTKTGDMAKALVTGIWLWWWAKDMGEKKEGNTELQ